MIGIDPISSLLTGINAISKFIDKNREQKAVYIELLEELKDNLKIIQYDYIKNDIPPEKIIKVLKINKLEKAEKARNRF